MESVAVTKSTPPNRRWLRFSLRGMLLIVAIFGIWLGVKVNAARRQAAAVAAILKAGGKVTFDYQMVPAKSGKPGQFDFDADAKPPTPPLLRTLFGEDFFRNVVGASLSGKINEDDLDCLASLPRLVSLELNEVRVVPPASRSPRPLADADLQVLRKLDQLQTLVVGGGMLRDADLAYIGELTRLKTLFIVSDAITNDGLRQLEGATSLRRVILWGTKVTPDGLRQLQTALPNASVADFPAKAAGPVHVIVP
jgi:hypothetical protein